MRLSARASGLVRFVVIAMTLVFTAVALVVGHADEVEPIRLEEGQPAPVTYTATRQISVVDEIATEQDRNEAAAGVDAAAELREIYAKDPVEFYSRVSTQAKYFPGWQGTGQEQVDNVVGYRNLDEERQDTAKKSNLGSEH